MNSKYKILKTNIYIPVKGLHFDLDEDFFFEKTGLSHFKTSK